MYKWLLLFLLLCSVALAGCSRLEVVNPHEHHYQKAQEHGTPEGHGKQDKQDKHNKHDDPGIPSDLGLSDTPGP